MLLGRTVCACLLHVSLAQASPEPVDEEDRRAAAKAAFSEAREAAGAGEYEAALEGFERARAIEPSAGIHYNIAVCHHRLMLQAEQGSEAYEARRQRAIEAYNRYLDAAPDAEDREDVEALISSLGGHPNTRDRWSIERIDPEPTPQPSPELREAEPPDARGDDGFTAPVEPPAPPATRTEDRLPRGRVGGGIVLMLANMRELSRTDEVVTLPLLGLSLRGGAFLGARHRINLGGEIALAGQPTATEARHRLGAGYIGVTLDYGHPIGKQRRFEIGTGGLVGVAGQSLRHSGLSPVTCPTSTETEGDRVISQRGGMLLGGRLTLAALLGPRRNHELALRITPGLGLHGSGQRGSHTTTGESCDGGATPFEELGMNGPALVVTIDLGYAPRF